MFTTLELDCERWQSLPTSPQGCLSPKFISSMQLNFFATFCYAFYPTMLDIKPIITKHVGKV